MLSFTEEQQLIFDWVKNGSGNCIIEAVAGSGKTTTIIRAAQLMQGRIFLGAFNKAIAEEIRKRINDKPASGYITVSTLHSEALKYLRHYLPTTLLVKDKYQELISKHLNLHTEEVLPLVHARDKKLRYQIVKLLSIARQQGLSADSANEEWLSLAQTYSAVDPRSFMTGEIFTIISIGKFLLVEGLKTMDQGADFEDMLYYWTATKQKIDEELQYDCVIIDEAQDINTTRRNFIKRILKPHGRLIAVGDSYQAIYGFSGACHQSIERIRQELNCKHTFYLSKSFRCPKLMVEKVKELVPIIESGSPHEGEILSHYTPEFRFYDFFSEHHFKPGDAILCRNNQPLIRVYLILMKRNIRCHLEGSDLAKDMLYLIAKYKMYAKTVSDLKLRLLKELQTSTDTDMLRAVIELLDHAETISQAESLIRNAFRDTTLNHHSDDVTLSTVHKAKGREWDTVYILGRKELMPSPNAKQNWEKRQEYNLIYVAVTRAKRTLHEVPIS